MQTTNMNEQTPVTRRRARLISYSAILGIVVLVVLWFITRRGDSPKPISSAATSGMGGMMMAPTTTATNDVSGPAIDPQVDLAADDLKKAEIRTVKVGKDVTAAKLRVPGIVKPDEYREVHVTSLVGGVVKQVPVVLGDHVRRGQSLAVIFSTELAEAETQYLSTAAELDAEHKKLVRTQNLVLLGAASKQEEEEVTAMHATHEAHVRAALERLKLLGASDRQVAALKQAEQIDPNFAVPAPISGVVLSRSTNLGLVVNPTQELFTVADLSTVWVMASLNEMDFAAVRVGSTASVTAPAYPGRVWKGRVKYIQPQVDPTTRTAQARIEVSNPGESLRIEMYVDVDFASKGALGPVVPEVAVQSIGGRQVVFLPIKDSEGSFVLRNVRLGPPANGYYPVLEGLKEDDKVVTEGSFILKAEAVRQHPEFH